MKNHHKCQYKHHIMILHILLARPHTVIIQHSAKTCGKKYAGFTSATTAFSIKYCVFKPTQLFGSSALTFSFMVSMASRTHPTVPSPPHTRTRTLPGGRRVHICKALEGGSSERSNTWRKQKNKNKIQTIIQSFNHKKRQDYMETERLAEYVNVSTKSNDTCTGFRRVRNSPSKTSPMLLPLLVFAKTRTGVQPLPHPAASCMH